MSQVSWNVHWWAYNITLLKRYSHIVDEVTGVTNDGQKHKTGWHVTFGPSFHHRTQHGEIRHAEGVEGMSCRVEKLQAY